MNWHEHRSNNGSRRGVALIVVLGFLSIMIVMALAFLTQARVERQVADATLEAMRGRQLVRTAVHAAMNDYSVELAQAGLVMPPANSVYDLFVSVPPTALFGMEGQRKIGQDNVNLLVGEVEDWIPRRYTNAPYFARTSVTNEAEWILVREDPTATQPSRILGRYAYVIFDMSGGIDANLIARDANIAANDARVASNRVRRSVRQVPMGLLPETLNASQFKSYRSGWKGFDSLFALIRLTDGYPNDGNAGSDDRWQGDRKEKAPPAALASNLVSDLAPFSLSVFRGGRYTPASATWSTPILCGSQPWSTVLSPISAQFAPVPTPWGSWINNAINDYTNSSMIPIGTDYPSPKNVPMFNEVNMQIVGLTETVVTPSNSTYTLDVRLTFEFWYPFPSADNANPGVFTVPFPTIGGSPAASGSAQIWCRVMMMGGSPPAPVAVGLGPFTPTPATLNVQANFTQGRPYTPSSGGSNFVYASIPIAPMGGALLGTNLSLLINSVNVVQPIYLEGPAGGHADMLPGGIPLYVGAPITVVPHLAAAPPPTSPLPFVRAVTDPRLNHVPGQWVSESSSLGAMNRWFTTSPARFQAEGTNMYCRNGPMETPAELGFIPSGNEWGTIDICTADAVDVLANLVADTNLFATWSRNGVVYTNGTINPNTRSSNVLAAAFIDLPTHEVPNVATAVAGANPINEATARYIAGQILAATSNGTRATAFQAGSDWARIPAMQQTGALRAVLNNNQREALVRNTWGLFSPDNSLFTVVVVAQAIKEGPDAVDPVGVWNPNADTITGERRAVALVWRDPFKNGNNLHHEMFVRMFRYLND